MPGLKAWLEDGPLVTDGAWGTELQRRGLDHGQCPDAWNLDFPDRVRAVARSYLEAGSQVILTNTFRANPIALAGYGLADKAAEINLAGARISRAAAEGRALVFASMGPTGKMLFAGEVGAGETRAAFSLQARALADGGADALLLETMSDIEEARIALEAALETGLPVVVSFVFDAGKLRPRTMTGASPEQTARQMTAAGAHAVGANCGHGIAAFPDICRDLKAHTDLPVWIKANAGLPKVENGAVHYASNPEEFAAFLPELLAAGAGFVGGCCGTHPGYIQAIRQRMPVRIRE